MRDILVVEDGANERDRLQRLFEASHFSVSVAESAQEAEALLGLGSYRLVVIDIGLGDKSGTYLFELLKRKGSFPYVIVLTGNPSVHLKQRFLDEGAVAYIVKASPAATNDALSDLVHSLLGAPTRSTLRGLPLADFLRDCVVPAAHELFLDEKSAPPTCRGCGAREFVVIFDHKTQLPPLVEGKVICVGCQRELDPEFGE